LRSQNNSKKSKESSQLDEKEFGTNAQGGSISFVEKDVTLSKRSSPNKKVLDFDQIDNSVNSGYNTIKEALNIDYQGQGTGHVKYDRGPTPQSLIKIQNEKNSTQGPENQQTF
jgi:hypothetical protein